MTSAYVFQAALLCADCGAATRLELEGANAAPIDPNDESSYDSDTFPKGPYASGAGEADSPQHCDACGEFLENPLTPDGRHYVAERLARFERESGPIPAGSLFDVYRDFYSIDSDEVAAARDARQDRTQ